MKNMKWIIGVLTCLFLVQQATAHVGPDVENRRQRVTLRNNCAPSTAEVDLAVNNVRARLLVAGELFTSMSDGRYIVPKREPGSGLDEISSIYAAAVWVGGFQASEEGEAPTLKMAAATFRQTDGVDFWPGPLTPNDGTTTAQRCREWDRFFRVTGASIRQHIQNYERYRDLGQPYPAEEVPEELRAWPALGNPYFNEFYDFELPDSDVGLGNYADIDENGIYDPTGGDFPIIDIAGCDPVDNPQFPDDMYFFVYNDNGNSHEVTRSEAIRMEVQVQAFGYATQDEVNNMTFYRYKLVNRAPEVLDSTYFAMWLDPDLGCPDDDFIGCDTATSLMYVYNEDPVDGINGCECNVGGIIPTYCNEVPILGVDYFRGPTGRVFDDQGMPMEVELGMTSFTYYNRSTGPQETRDPGSPDQFYNYLTGRWRDGTPLTEGGTGYREGDRETNYAFADPPDLNGGWSMCEENLERGDRRTLQATGPLRLFPGDIKELIIGVVWLPEATYPCPSIEPLLSADRSAQGLFDNCFDILDGPTPPLVTVLELDEELVFSVSDIDYDYREVDTQFGGGPDQDSTYRFEGIRVYQLRDASVAAVQASFSDPEAAREIAQYDLRNQVVNLYNWTATDNPNSPDAILVPQLQVEGENNGIESSFSVTIDNFAEGEENKLINFTEYYFAVVAYGTNNYEPYNVSTGQGQTTTYIINRDGNRSQVVATPRPTAHLDLNSMYGEGLEVTRLDGQGVTTNILNVSQETRELIATQGELEEIVYELGMSPLNAKIYDPVNIIDGTYTLTFMPYEDQPGLDSTLFIVVNDQTGVADTSTVPLGQISETLTRFGFSVLLGQDEEPGTNPFLDETNGFLGAAIEYADPTGEQWYNFVPEGVSPSVNFIKNEVQGEDEFDLDPNQVFSSEVNTGFYPFVLCAGDTARISLIDAGGIFYSPTWFNSLLDDVREAFDGLSKLNNVDIVFTSNRDLWSKCVVVQSANLVFSENIEEDYRNSMDLIRKPSVGIDTFPRASNRPALLDDGTVGYSYFPGYAVDVETGERLNIFFGENTLLDPANRERIGNLIGIGADNVDPNLLVGNDMMWNPNPTGGLDNIFAGNLHYIFVTNQRYDSCNAIHERLMTGAPGSRRNQAQKRRAFESVTWSGFPIMAADASLTSYADGLIPNDLTISLRVKNSFAYSDSTGLNGGLNQYRINVDGKQATTRVAGEQLESRLDMINVVPNPYYAYSRYELQSTENVVKVTNLPQVCTVTIYSLDGKFIRQYDRNISSVNPTVPNPSEPIPDGSFPTDLEWDLKNSQGILVSSGVYYIHVEAPGLGERVLKWFGVNRKFDPSAIN